MSVPNLTVGIKTEDKAQGNEKGGDPKTAALSNLRSAPNLERNFVVQIG
jgi:hypothetical protein